MSICTFKALGPAFAKHPFRWPCPIWEESPCLRVLLRRSSTWWASPSPWSPSSQLHHRHHHFIVIIITIVINCITRSASTLQLRGLSRWPLTGKSSTGTARIGPLRLFSVIVLAVVFVVVVVLLLLLLVRRGLGHSGYFQLLLLLLFSCCCCCCWYGEDWATQVFPHFRVLQL